jgi:hypothetical protein
MQFPWFMLGAAAAAGAGLAGVVWYENLSNDDKRQADQLMAQYARDLYSKTVPALTAPELEQVEGLARRALAA